MVTLNETKVPGKEMSQINFFRWVFSIWAYVVCWSLMVNMQSNGVQSVQACVSYKRRSELWFYPLRPPSFIYLYQLSHRFNVMLVLTVFGQSQSSVMTIGCEWISWIHGVQWPQSKQTGGRGPSLASCRSADVPQRRRYPCHCIDWKWYMWWECGGKMSAYDVLHGE